MANEVDAEMLRKLAQFSGDPWKPDNPYFEHAENFTEQSWAAHVTPFLKMQNLTRTLDLACGHGRHTERLRQMAQEVWALDIQPGNVEVCQKRFADAPNVRCSVNNGYDLQPVPNDWATMLFSFDAMVHFDSDVVRSYLRDAKRVLQKGGSGLFHHSNYSIGGSDWTKNPQSRNFMSAELFSHYARKEGLVILKQKVIGWAGWPEIDCISLFQRPAGG